VFLLALALGCATPRASSTAPAELTPLQNKFAKNPNDRAANMQLGAEAEATGDYLRAEQYYLRAEALGESQEVIVPTLLRVLVAAHRYQDALGRCELRLSRRPGDRATRYVAAALYQALDRNRDAERELEQLIHEQPADADAYLQMGQLYRDGLHDKRRARPMFEEYLKRAPSGDSAANVRFELDREKREGEP
jgi:tetratricopeptide (TPR) repeat protein